PNNQSSIDDPGFAAGYRAAYDTIYDRNDYASAIEQLKALGHDDSPNVANLIGYSYRKLGDYKQSQVWYERALTSDPNHVLTWNYYGFWQIEQGNREQAQYHLSRIGEICGTDCTEYRTLAAALDKPPGSGLGYRPHRRSEKGAPRKNAARPLSVETVPITADAPRCATWTPAERRRWRDS